MAFDRKEYGINSGIPFIKIANRVEVNVDLNGKRVTGPPVVFSSRQLSHETSRSDAFGFR
jgi:hypothetical protein